MIDATGMLSGKRRRVLDSTVVDDAVATQDTVTQLVAGIRRVRKLVPAAVEIEIAAHDYARPGTDRRTAVSWDFAGTKRVECPGGRAGKRGPQLRCRFCITSAPSRSDCAQRSKPSARPARPSRAVGGRSLPDAEKRR